MLSTLTALWSRGFGVLGRVSMYRLVLYALIALTVIALGLSLFGLVSPGAVDLLVTLVVAGGVSVAVDAGTRRLLRIPVRWESALITGFILLFVLRPTLDPLGLLGIAIAAAVAAISKYLLAWRGRHIFNPAAVGATALAALSLPIPALGTPSWWVGTPAMAGPVIVLGLVVLVRTEKVRIAAAFGVIAVGTAVVRTSVQYQAAGVEVEAGAVFWPILWSSPFLFLGAFMLSEPLTLPPRRWQQLTVAAVVGVLAGWPIPVGELTLGQERALLIGNLVAFALAARAGVRLILRETEEPAPSIRRLTFVADNPFRFTPGQYLELDVPHRGPDPRGTRREFSILSAPAELPTVQIAFRATPEGAPPSSYKRALTALHPGDSLRVTGVWGDFLLPTRLSAPVLMVAAGIGITPFVSQLRQSHRLGHERDIVLVYLVSEPDEVAFAEPIAVAGVPVIVRTRLEPPTLPAHWRWSRGSRLDADELLRLVPDIAARHAYVSGPPGLVADLAPALGRARSITTDAFAGY